MPLGTAWGPEPGGRYWGPGSRDSSCKASLGRGMLDDSSRCQYFSIVKFYCVESSEWSSTRFFQFPGTVPFLMCSIVEKVSSKTTCYWGKICPVIVLNARTTYPAWNCECLRYTLVPSLVSHLGSLAVPTYREASRRNMRQPQVCYSSRKTWNSMPANFWSRVFMSYSIYRLLYLCHAALNYKGHRMLITAYGHSLVVGDSLRLDTYPNPA